MFVVFFILFFVSTCCLVVGLIKPALVLRWGSKRTRLRAAGWYLLFTAIFFFLTAATAPKTRQDAQTTSPQPEPVSTATAQHEAKQPQQEAKQKENIQDSSIKQHDDNTKEIAIDVGDLSDNTPHEQQVTKQVKVDNSKNNVSEKQFKFNIQSFVKRYNTSAKKLGEATIKISSSKDKDDKSGKVHLLTSSNKYVGFTVTTNKSGFVTDSIMIGAGDGTPASGVRVILSMASYFDVFEPGIKKEGRKEILKGLGILSGELPDNATYTHNNVTYKLINTKGAGIWLVAEPAE